MFVLGRREGESIILRCPDGIEIEVKVIRQSTGALKLGIEAPETVTIIRKELLETKERG